LTAFTLAPIVSPYDRDVSDITSIIETEHEVAEVEVSQEEI
jgi:hypothetical protein